MLDFGFYNMDCMEGMKEFPDNYFDLAVVDPPYGSMRRDKYKKIERTGGGYAKKYGKKIINWDFAPDKSYFDELFRVSKKQIIWGGNYFNEFLPSCRNFIIWLKATITESFSMAMAEYAWTSIQGNAKVYKCAPQGSKNNPRFHPTQKPIKLYEWLLNRYAKKGDKILDTHVGSASSLIACYKNDLDFVGFEIDEDYYSMAKKRLEQERAQIKFDI